MNRGRWEYEWQDVPAIDVMEGDLYANVATVTEVVIGPRVDRDPFDNVAADEVLIRCGQGWARKGKKRSMRAVVGRNARYITPSAHPKRNDGEMMTGIWPSKAGESTHALDDPYPKVSVETDTTP